MIKKFRKYEWLFLCLFCLILAGCANNSGAQLKKYLDLGQKYLTEMDYEQAIIAYNKAIEIDPKNIEAYQALTNIYEFQGDLDQARITMERALTAIPSNSELQTRYERLMLMPSSEVSSSAGQNTSGSPFGNQSTDQRTEDGIQSEGRVQADGWVQVNGKWYFYVGGEKAAGWMQQGENWFYFDEDGVLQHGKTRISDDWYFFNEDGVMVTGWKEDGGKWYYFGPDGKMLTDQWIEDTFYVGPDGAMLISTTAPDGQEVDADGRKIVKLPTAEYINYLRSPDFFLASEILQDRWREVDFKLENDYCLYYITQDITKNGFFLFASEQDIVDCGNYYEVKNQKLEIAKTYRDIDALPISKDELRKRDWNWFYSLGYQDPNARADLADMGTYKILVMPNGEYTVSSCDGNTDFYDAVLDIGWKGSFYIRKDARVNFKDESYTFDPQYHTYDKYADTGFWNTVSRKTPAGSKDHCYIVEDLDENGYIKTMRIRTWEY